MSKEFQLVPDPTFTAPVPIHVPGKSSTKVKFTFRRMTLTKYKEWLEGIGDKEDLVLIKEIATGWELTDPFDDEHINTMLEHHINSGTSIVETFMKENAPARLGNFPSSRNG